MQGHIGHQSATYLQKFWVVIALTVPIFLYSDMAREVFGLTFYASPLLRYTLLGVGSLVFFYGGSIFFIHAFHELRARLPGMMTLVSLAILAAYSYSVFATLTHTAHDLLFELSSLIAIMLLGHHIEMRAVRGVRGALHELAKVLPDTAEVVEGDTTSIKPLAEVREGDIVLVRSGGKVPADSVVIEGSSEVNEAIITGESNPVSKHVGDEIVAGSLNGDGALRARVVKIGEATFLAGIMRLVAEAEASKSRLQILSDRAAYYLTLIAIGAGTITFVAWVFVGAGVVTAVERLVAVLVVACPHALGLAVPLVASISTTMAARNGFLIKRRLALEAARSVDTVLFDKTGTLTEGKFSVVSASSDEALALAASVDAQSEHPIARAIVAEATARGLKKEEARNAQRIPGAGAEATVAGKRVFVGHRGGKDIVVEVAGEQVGSIVVRDTARRESKEAVETLHRMGIAVAMITGDSAETAAAVAGELGIEQYFARVAPGEKAEKVRFLQGGGKRVAFVGDGVNDAPALAEADLGVAVGAGTNVAIESAGIVLVENDPRDITKIITLSRRTYRKMMENLFWATGYNVVAIPLAAGALAVYGILLEPWLAAVLMSASTVIVAVNALLLRRRAL